MKAEDFYWCERCQCPKGGDESSEPCPEGLHHIWTNKRSFKGATDVSPHTQHQPPEKY
jgi:hypothetical protein